jgi:hypothetical protein
MFIILVLSIAPVGGNCLVLVVECRLSSADFIECRVSLSVVCCLFLVVGCRRLPGVDSFTAIVSVVTQFFLCRCPALPIYARQQLCLWFVRTVYGVYSEERAALHG